MTFERRQSMLARPPAIAVHDNRDVPRNRRTKLYGRRSGFDHRVLPGRSGDCNRSYDS
jgi:hypothetical protein